MDAFDRPLYILELLCRVRVLKVGDLARQPNWTPATASRSLSKLLERGWVEKVNDKGRPKYMLGPKAINLSPDLRF